jgi:hypothetical protein
MGADDVLRAIVVAMGETPAGGVDQRAHPWTIWIRWEGQPVQRE